MTIKEIADIVGTSRGTVDRVLNNRGNVRPDLADAVRRVAHEAGYTPNSLARALVNSQKRYSVGVIINSVGNSFFGDVLEGIALEAAHLKSYGLRVDVREIRGWDEKEQLSAIESMTEIGVDAIAITPLGYPAIVHALNTAAVPVVTLNTDVEGVNKLAFVGCDYLNSGMLMGDLARMMLKDAGRIGAVIGDSHILGHVQRIEGLRASIALLDGMQVTRVVENHDDEGRSYEVTRRLIEEEVPDLLCFAAGGVEGGVQAVVDSRKPIPVITVDETPYTKARLHEGVITATITQQPKEQGRRTIEVLYNYLANKIRPAHVHNYMENQVKLRSSK